MVLSLQDHIARSIADILSTPLGTRVMRPDYGSELPRLVDQPMNKDWKIRVFAATADALRKWEPRIEVISAAVDEIGAGTITLTVKYRVVGDDDTKEATVSL